MFALLQGPGGPFRRLAGEVVPLLVGFAAGWMAWPFLRWGGLAVGIAVSLAVSWALVRVRRRPVLRRVWRVALLLHVLFWSWQGVLATEVRPAGPIEVHEVRAHDAAAPFRAGFGEAPFAFDEAALAGYGARERRKAIPAFGGLGVLGRLSLASMDPGVPMLAHAERDDSDLGARALVVLPDGGTPWVVVRLDLVVIDDGLAKEIAEGIAKDAPIGPRPAAVCVLADHTHSGPGGFHPAPLAQVVGTDHLDPKMRVAIRDAALRAVTAALDAARPARLALARATDRDAEGRPILARNRHKKDEDAIDDRVLALRFEEREGGRLLGVLLNYAVHPTVLGPRHLAFSRDLAGAVEEAVSARLPGRPPVLFAEAALGDVGPRRSDADAEADVRGLAERFADRIGSDLLTGTTLDAIAIRSAVATRDLGSPRAFACFGSRRAFGEATFPNRWDAARVLALPVNAIPWSLGVSELRVSFSFDGAFGAMVDLDREVPTRRRSFGAVVLEGDGLRLPVLWLPGEPTQALGKAWRKAAESLGLATPMIFALTNGSMAYVAAPDEWDEQRSYEAAMTLYGRDTAVLVEDAVFRALDAALGAPAVSSSGGR